MNELYRRLSVKILSSAQGIFSGALISILALILVYHRHVNEFLLHLNWTLFLFFAICIFTGFIVCLYLPSVSKSLPFFLGIFYLFCYTACAALCQKLDLTPLYTTPDEPVFNKFTQTPELLVIPGLVLIFLAAVIQIKAAFNDGKNNKKHLSIKEDILSKHPFYKSWLLFMTGVSLFFGVWLPLLALPGALVFFEWLN